MTEELRAALLNLRESLCQENGIPGITHIDGPGYAVCPTCSPWWNPGEGCYHHDHDCALAVLLGLIEALPEDEEAP